MDKQVGIELLPDGASFEMIKVEGGSYWMGSKAHKNYQPVHEVHISDFWIGKHLVTQELWQYVMGNNPALVKAKSHPVESISWKEIQLFLQKLNQLTSSNYRLPTESEWEYAARGGKESRGFLYAGSNKLKEIAWYGPVSHGETKPVGLKCPNELGLYDMTGNLFEWCADHWRENYEGAPTDGSVWNQAPNPHLRVVRGGAFNYNPRSCTVYHRFGEYVTPGLVTVGFRLARS